MTPLQTAREALVVEALGEVTVLADRIEAASAQLSSVTAALAQTCERLEAQCTAADQHMLRLAEHARGVAAKHIANSSRSLMREAAEVECQALAAFSRALFHSELNPALSSLVQAAKACAESQWRLNGWACATSAAVSAILTGALTSYLLSM